MVTPRSANDGVRVVILLALVALVSLAWGQSVTGTLPAGAVVVDADVVAEARLALAWFPVEVGRGRIDADGAFELRFHQPLPLEAEIAMPAVQLFAEVRCEGLTLSDPAARVVLLRDLRVIPAGAPCEYCETLGWLSFGTRPRGAHPATGDLELQWLYVDRPLSVSGSCRYGWGSETYVLDLHPGWNTLLLETLVVYPSEGYCDCRDVLVSAVPGYPDADVAWHMVLRR